MFVMDQYAITVQSFLIDQLRQPTPNFILLKKIVDKCVAINSILEHNTIFHNDQHFNNFMLKSILPGDIEDIEHNVKIIDFGEASNKSIDDNVMFKKINIVSMPQLSECVKEKQTFLEYILSTTSTVKMSNMSNMSKLTNIQSPLPNPANEEPFITFVRGQFVRDLSDFYKDISMYSDFPDENSNPKDMEKYKNTYDTYSKIIQIFDPDIYSDLFESFGKKKRKNLRKSTIKTKYKRQSRIHSRNHK